MRKLDLDGKAVDAFDKAIEVTKKKKVISNEKEIETLLEVIENTYPRLIVRSNTGKKYTIVLNDDSYQSKCSCPSWIFRGAKLAKEAGKVGREPCKHIRAIKIGTIEGLTTSIGRRFAILDF